MANEQKKGGFWSWLGLGNKKEQEEQIADSEAQSELSEQVEELVDDVKDKIEQLAEKAEDITDQVEENIDQLQAHVEQKTDQFEAQLKQSVSEFSQKFEDFEHKIDDNLQNLKQDATAYIEQVKAEFSENEPHFEDKSTDKLEHESAVENSEISAQTAVTHSTDLDVSQVAIQTQEKPSEGGFFSRLVKGLLKTKQNIGAGFRSLFTGKKIDDELFEELEEQLLIADIGMPTTTKIISHLTEHASRAQLKDADMLYQQLKVEMAEILKPVEQPLVIDSSKKPYVILMVGVNGVGKTTTIGKLARQFQQQGKSVMLAAGDTFRAAAVEQLQVWGERNNIPVVAQSTGSDSASVIFDAMQSAAARNIDILIADTAGRLQNKNNLMDELKKIVRVMKKYDETAPHEIMLTLDAGTGQNAISQAKLFHEAVGLTGISLTKLDGTAKGGVIFAIADQFNLPIRYIGVGEKIEDLRPFHAEEFIDALFTHEEA
ncbi:signal recognition particle-docking protein FtsY [Pasteurella bettyae]|uniref:Signal recognition particle receptor FtsY n=1 Tax=Pasteurella bettyae CCUG 2042 TaxID=1095749 RepID=I3DBM2_9PAST|nr:signal recognition particle-docking protein FtsY [Pasteurella bettyae]EIJ69115.1 signal recognition particle-docking protein FtsY [Pasteurella bettyae CCUG 2042]